MTYGGAIIGTKKIYEKLEKFLPSEKMRELTEKANEAEKKLQQMYTKLEDNRVALDEEGELLINNQRVEKGEARVQEIEKEGDDVIKSMQEVQTLINELKPTQKSKAGIILTYGLITDEDTPQNILKRKIAIAEKESKGTKDPERKKALT